MSVVSFYMFLMFLGGTERDQWYDMGSWLTRQIALKMLTSPQTTLMISAKRDTIEVLCMWITSIDAYIIGAANIVPITNPLPI